MKVAAIHATENTFALDANICYDYLLFNNYYCSLIAKITMLKNSVSIKTEK